MKNLDWVDVLERLSSLATSQRAKEHLAKTEPMTDQNAASVQISQTLEAQQILALGKRPFMESLDLFPVWQSRLSKEATLRPLELRDVRHFCLEAIALDEVLAPSAQSWGQSIKSRLVRGEEPLSAIEHIMTPEGEIRTDASEELFKLHNEKKQIVRQTQNTLDQLIHKHELETVLQDRYVTNREGRWVLPVRSGKQHDFEGIIHASSHSKQTVFMEPKDIIPLNNRLRQIEVDIEEEIERLLRTLSEYLRRQLTEFKSTEAAMLEADIRFAQGQLANQIQGQPPRFSDGPIRLVDLRHPLLSITSKDVVANTVELQGDDRILLLSGPNAGGKTVLLKAVGLAAQMARCGLMVASGPEPRLPFFKNLHVGVGDSQSVDQHLSTFAAHLNILNRAANEASKDSLILIDEICGSTDPEEGTALARAFIERFAETKCLGVVTSHLGPLKIGWSRGSGVINGSMEYDGQTGRPTYRFFMGVPGQSLALQTARRVGVDAEIVEKAFEYLSPESKRYHASLDEIETVKTELTRQQLKLNEQLKESEKTKAKYEKLVQQMESEKEILIEKAVGKAEKKIQQLIEQGQADDVFKKHERLLKIKTEMPEIVRAQSGGQAQRVTKKIETAQDFAEAYPAGSRVFAPSIGRDGIVQSAPNQKGEVTILSQSMRLSVLWNQLEPPHNSLNPTQNLIRQAGLPGSTQLSSDRQIDVRGRTLDDALLKIEEDLDKAVVNQEGRVKIVHGHGTDTLKKGIRNYLTRSVYVVKWFAGTADSGGQGVTWVELN